MLRRWLTVIYWLHGGPLTRIVDGKDILLNCLFISSGCLMSMGGDFLLYSFSSL